MVVLTVGLAALGSAASAVAQDAETAKVDYPTGYRDWTHVKSMVIQPGHQLYESFGGIHHIYANQSALEGYRTGSFADGSVIIFDLLEATAADNAITEGKCKVGGISARRRKRAVSVGRQSRRPFRLQPLHRHLHPEGRHARHHAHGLPRNSSS